MLRKNDGHAVIVEKSDVLNSLLRDLHAEFEPTRKRRRRVLPVCTNQIHPIAMSLLLFVGLLYAAFMSTRGLESILSSSYLSQQEQSPKTANLTRTRNTAAQHPVSFSSSSTNVALHEPPAGLCPSASAVRPFLSQQEAREILANYFRIKIKPGDRLKPKLNPGIDVQPILRYLLEESTKRDKLLLTLQLGGNDGVSGDPIHKALVSPGLSLDHWMPVVVEPVLSNIVNLKKTYQEHHDQRGLKCSHIARWAVAYGDLVENDKTCTFYRFNDSPTAPQECHGKADWIKTQIGSLLQSSNPCLVADKVPCGSITDLFSSIGLAGALDKVALVQIDVEGYEAVLLPAFLKEAQERGFSLPPVFNYEAKIVKLNDKSQNTHVLEDIRNFFRSKGFDIHRSHGDLAVRYRSLDDLAVHSETVST